MTVLKLRGEGVAWTDVDGEIVALDESAAVYLAANESGGLLWRALADGTTLEQLATLLAGEYALTQDRAAADAGAFVAELRERGLLEG